VRPLSVALIAKMCPVAELTAAETAMAASAACTLLCGVAVVRVAVIKMTAAIRESSVRTGVMGAPPSMRTSRETRNRAAALHTPHFTLFYAAPIHRSGPSVKRLIFALRRPECRRGSCASFRAAPCDQETGMPT
jgi:hypothetical protein